MEEQPDPDVVVAEAEVREAAPEPELVAPEPSPVCVPVGWLLTHAPSPIAARALRELAGFEDEGLTSLTLSYRPSLELAARQQFDGGFGPTMLTAPADADRVASEGVGTILAVRRLLEAGWRSDCPGVVRSRRILFRLLAEDDDRSVLYEFSGAATNAEGVQHGRGILREAAAAVLAQAGFEADPRLRGAAQRLLDRIDRYLTSPLREKPWVRVGNKQVLSEDAFPPSIFALTMLAHMSAFRLEHHVEMERLYAYLCEPLPRQQSQQLFGERIFEQPHLVLGDRFPHRNAVDADIPAALDWLEVMARLGFLRRNEGWMKLFERLLEERDRDLVWQPRKGTGVPGVSPDAWVWPTYPIGSAPEARRGEITFRLGLIAHLAGRTLEFS